MVWHHMSFEYLYPFVLAQSSDYFLQVCSILIVYDLSSVFRNEHYVVLAHPFCMCQTVCLVCHKFSFHCRNRLDTLLYHVWRIFGITFVTHPHSGWLSVSHFVLNCLKALIKTDGTRQPYWCRAPSVCLGERCNWYGFVGKTMLCSRNNRKSIINKH